MFKVALGQRGGQVRDNLLGRGEIEWNKHHIGDKLECSRQSDMCKMRIVDRIFSMAITALGTVYCSP